MATPRVSLCMIVRDEESHIADCIESVLDLVDELVVVDTGSTDGTIGIVESYGVVDQTGPSRAEAPEGVAGGKKEEAGGGTGAGGSEELAADIAADDGMPAAGAAAGGRPTVKVYREEWTDDFSAARNVSLRNATGEWILYLDADERLAEGESERLRPLIESGEHGAIEVVVRSLMPFGNLVRSQSHNSIRIWRNRPDIRFEGAVHNQIAPAIERAALLVLHSDIVIEHYGYAEGGERRAGRRTQLLQMLASEVSLHPDDSFSRYNYGVALHSAGMNAEARGELQQAVDAGSEQLGAEVLHNALTRLAQIAVAERDLDEAEGYASRAIALDDREPLPHYLLAAVHFEREQFSDSLSELGRVLEIAVNSDQGPRPATEIDLAEVYADIGNCYNKLSLFDLAEVEYRRSLGEKPLPITFFNLGCTCLRQGKLEDAISAYENALLLDPELERARQSLDFCLKLRGTPSDGEGSGDTPL